MMQLRQFPLKLHFTPIHFPILTTPLNPSQWDDIALMASDLTSVFSVFTLTKELLYELVELPLIWTDYCLCYLTRLRGHFGFCHGNWA